MIATPNAPSRYRLDERLGAGGMAEVFRGTMLGAAGFERTVAIKRILPGLAHEERIAELFVQEAHIISRLRHPNIVSVLDFERDSDGRLLLVLEFVDGIDLAKLLASGPLPHAVILFLVSEILGGLGYAHNLPADDGVLGIVHRDLSPHNILLSWEGAVKVADFGLAKPHNGGQASASLVPQGKYAFMSPEQIGGHALDGRSDLFSVGVVLWEMLTGERLFGRSDVESTIWRVLDETIPRPSSIRPVPPDLERIAMKLLKRNAMKRYQTAEAALADLALCTDASSARGRLELVQLLAARFPDRSRSRRVRSSHAVPVRRSPHADIESPPQGRRPGRPRRLQLLALAVALCAVVVGVLVGLRVREHAARGRPAEPSVGSAPPQQSTTGAASRM